MSENFGQQNSRGKNEAIKSRSKIKITQNPNSNIHPIYNQLRKTPNKYAPYKTEQK